MKISIDVLPTGQFPYFDIDTNGWCYLNSDGLFYDVDGPQVRLVVNDQITLDPVHTRFALPMHMMPVELKTEICEQRYSEIIFVRSGDGRHMGVLAKAVK